MQHTPFTRRSVRWATTLLLTMAITGCGCNAIDCVSGLYVHLDSAPTGTVRVDLLNPGDNTVPSSEYSVQCTVALPCTQDIFFPKLMPARIDVRVTTVDGTRTSQFTSIQYTPSFANGENCGKACSTATVSVRMPQ